MDMLLMVLAIIILALIAVGIFLLGALFSRNIMADIHDEVRRMRLTEEYYTLAGVKTPADPKPYVPPVRGRTAVLPGMSKIDRLMKQGKRGTVMWRGGTHNG